MKRIILAVSLLLSTATNAADNQMSKVESAWNSGDVMAVQQNFNRDAVGSQARFAHYAEQGGVLTIINSRTVAPKTLAAIVQLEDKREVWLFIECRGSSKWCHWDRRSTSIVGGAESGQGLDLATTAVAIEGMGFVEANPLGLGVIVPTKIGLTYGTHFMEYEDCMSWRAGLDSVGFGAGAANIATMLGGHPAAALAVLAATSFMRYDPAAETAQFECAEYALDRE